METEATTTSTPKETLWATISLISSLLAYVLALLSYLLGLGLALCCAFPCWIASLVFGIVALVEIRTKRPAFKGKRQAIIGICASAIPLIITIAIGWMIYSALRGEPYDESNPQLVLATIEKNCDFRFPEKMESLKAADRLAGGPDPPYVLFKVTFTTDQMGFAQLQHSLSKLDSYVEIQPDEYVRSHPIDRRNNPKWYKTGPPERMILVSSGISKNNQVRLTTIVIKSLHPEKFVICMEGVGSWRLKENNR